MIRMKSLLTSCPAFLLLQLFLCSSLHARLGETAEELKARFGEPKTTAPELTTAQGKMIEIGKRSAFVQGDWRISVSIIEDRSAKETYSKPGDWTEDQFTTVLTSNSQGAAWTETSKTNLTKLKRSWTRADGGAAVWVGGAMTVTNPAFERAKKKAAEKAKAEASRIPRI
jgi:hypothetical protein